MPKITLKAARVNAGLSQREVAEKLNVAQTTIRNWERGVTSPKFPQVSELCRMYGVAYDDIFFDYEVS